MIILEIRPIVWYTVASFRLMQILALFASILSSLLVGGHALLPKSPPQLLSSHSFSLAERDKNSYVNRVFSENILINLGYLSGAFVREEANHPTVTFQPFWFDIVLGPQEVFAYHDSILDKYKNARIRTTQTHFDFGDGYISDGFLYGDGVCHLASLIYWSAVDAGLEAYAPTNHDFRAIPGVPRQYGVAIYANPQKDAVSKMENLYIKNNKNRAITLKFAYENDSVSVSVLN